MHFIVQRQRDLYYLSHIRTGPNQTDVRWTVDINNSLVFDWMLQFHSKSLPISLEIIEWKNSPQNIEPFNVLVINGTLDCAVYTVEIIDGKDIEDWIFYKQLKSN